MQVWWVVKSRNLKRKMPWSSFSCFFLVKFKEKGVIWAKPQTPWEKGKRSTFPSDEQSKKFQNKQGKEDRGTHLESRVWRTWSCVQAFLFWLLHDWVLRCQEVKNRHQSWWHRTSGASSCSLAIVTCLPEDTESLGLAPSWGWLPHVVSWPGYWG